MTTRKFLSSDFIPILQQSWNFERPKKLVISKFSIRTVKVVLFILNRAALWDLKVNKSGSHPARSCKDYGYAPAIFLAVVFQEYRLYSIFLLWFKNVAAFGKKSSVSVCSIFWYDGSLIQKIYYFRFYSVKIYSVQYQAKWHFEKAQITIKISDYYKFF